MIHVGLSVPAVFASAADLRLRDCAVLHFKRGLSAVHQHPVVQVEARQAMRAGESDFGGVFIYVCLHSLAAALERQAVAEHVATVGTRFEVHRPAIPGEHQALHQHQSGAGRHSEQALVLGPRIGRADRELGLPDREAEILFEDAEDVAVGEIGLDDPIAQVATSSASSNRISASRSGRPSSRSARPMPGPSTSACSACRPAPRWC